MTDADPVSSLILDFLSWLDHSPRSYADCMETWRTSCPRLTVWEDSFDIGFVTRRHDEEGDWIDITEHGRRHLHQERGI